MSFVLAPRDEIKSRVTLNAPIDFGKTEKFHIEVTWKRLPVSEKKAIIDNLTEKQITDDDVLEQMIVNISGCKDQDGDNLTYDKELLTRLLEEDFIRKPLTEEAFGLIFGKEATKALRQKN
jgi:hypothetical protein